MCIGATESKAVGTGSPWCTIDIWPWFGDFRDVEAVVEQHDRKIEGCKMYGDGEVFDHAEPPKTPSGLPQCRCAFCVTEDSLYRPYSHSVADNVLGSLLLTKESPTDGFSLDRVARRGPRSVCFR